MVRVLSNTGQRLMPCSPRTARKLLKSGKAEVVGNNPFVIKLKYGTSGYKQSNKFISRKSKECKLRTSQVFRIARKYYKTSAKRQLVRKVYRLSRQDGLEYMATLMQTTIDYIANIGAIELYKKTRNCARRGRKFRTKPLQENDLEISALANELAGGGAVNITGGKRTTHKAGFGSVRSASSEQAWQAKLGN